MKKLVLLMTMAISLAFVSCDDDDDIVEVKDYDLKTFSANYNYTDGSYLDQIYFSFTDSLIAKATYDTDDWTQFYLIPDSAATNYTSDIQGWDVVFTNYTTNLGTDTEPFAHNVTGALINIEEGIEVAFMEYMEYDNTDSISKAFVNLSLADVGSLDYSTESDAIGYTWKSLDHTTFTFTVSTNYFYIVKLNEEDYYKLRFVSFYGSTTSERIATIEYQLMQ